MDESLEQLGIVDSEFACVRLSIDRSGNGPRLRIEDMSSDRVGYVDALILEALCWASDEHLRTLLDPSSERWREAE
ncbi:MAG TPA: hypothetical protein VGJ14_11060 [Sporichthyaceae bacterium]|jgi:hypothetical protein